MQAINLGVRLDHNAAFIIIDSAHDTALVLVRSTHHTAFFNIRTGHGNLTESSLCISLHLLVSIVQDTLRYHAHTYSCRHHFTFVHVIVYRLSRWRFVLRVVFSLFVDGNVNFQVCPDDASSDVRHVITILTCERLAPHVDVSGEAIRTRVYFHGTWSCCALLEYSITRTVGVL